MRMKLDWGSSVSDLTAHMRESRDDMHDRIDGVVKDTASELLRTARAYTPVDTGRLKAGWKTIKERTGVSVVNPVEYAVPVEYGSLTRMPARMLGRAMLTAGNRLTTRLAAAGRANAREFNRG